MTCKFAPLYENIIAGLAVKKHEEVKMDLRDAEAVHVDETSFSVGGKGWWLWSFSNDEYVLYRLVNSRGSGVLEEVLGEDFDGWIICDGLSAYPAFTDVDPTNNQAERNLREPIVIRKTIGTLRNEKGTRIFERIMTMIATWKRQGLNPKEEMLKIIRG
ncbi:hypothetical protein AKJ37_05790 [candidate division MSBL1 archaeon SCGC-AAA259I09]|uniref:Transposase IS66 central domain-containing protein n=1 Tax=candidate division MSBL1 archaeon SCGC-AAA259I09 TaxID=1698267 RepID=A0A133UQ18_9EURY|nr:hypothetical protein AKJ37_05790 [candidate division MSBL1 archaeon SCGC-AAA259I09]